MTGHYREAWQGDEDQQWARSPRARRTALLAAAIAAIVVAAAVLLPMRLRISGNAVASSQQQTEQAQVPPGFVPPPTRPTPLPDPVTCHYQPDGKEPIKSVTPPANGEVPAKGVVRATINTNIGAIPAVLDRSLAPCTVSNFVHLADQGFYGNTGCVSGKVRG